MNSIMVQITLESRFHLAQRKTSVEARNTIESDEFTLLRSSSRSTQGSGMSFLLVVLSTWSLEWKISDVVKSTVRHRDFAGRAIDGAVYWNSTCSKLRREVECVGAGTTP